MATPGNPRPKGRKRKDGDEFITYPDAGVFCGQAEYYKGDQYTITNPIALFEVLSPSTRVYDRNTKAEEYKKIPGIAYYVMLDAEQVWLECRQRGEQDSWIELAPLTNLADNLRLFLNNREIVLSLAMLYEGVTFEEDE